MPKKSKNALDGEIITIHRGLAIYKVNASPYWQARIRDPRIRRYVVRSTEETSRIKAKQVARELAFDLLGAEKRVEREYTFRYYATRLMAKGERLVANGERNANYVRTTKLFLDQSEWGLVKAFGHRDIRDLKTRDYQEFMDGLSRKRPDLSTSTRNMLTASFRNVLKVARDDGVIDSIPSTPRTRQKDNPRSYFPFHPLVAKEDDAYQAILKAAQKLAEDEVKVRGERLHIIHNKPVEVTARRQMTIYKSRKTLQNRMIQALRDGKRCFVASNSKNTVNVLDTLLRKELGPKIKIMTITSENSRGKAEVRFVENIQAEILKVQALLTVVEKPDPATPNKSWKDAQRDVREFRIEGILNAGPVDDATAQELSDAKDRGVKLTKEDNFRLQRYELEKAYSQPVSRMLIERDNGGKLRNQIQVYRQIFNAREGSQSWIFDLQNDIQACRALHRNPLWVLCVAMLMSAGLMDGQKLLVRKVIRGDDLGLFKKTLRINRVLIEEAFEAPLRRDFESNPVRQLNALIGKAGLKLIPVKRRQISGNSSVEYFIDNSISNWI